jgi:hypothetical protein
LNEFFSPLVINAWALSKQPKGAARAESIIKKMIALNVSGDFDIQPNVVSFTTGIVSALSFFFLSCGFE